MMKGLSFDVLKELVYQNRENANEVIEKVVDASKSKLLSNYLKEITEKNVAIPIFPKLVKAENVFIVVERMLSGDTVPAVKQKDILSLGNDLFSYCLILFKRLAFEHPKILRNLAKKIDFSSVNELIYTQSELIKNILKEPDVDQEFFTVVEDLVMYGKNKDKYKTELMTCLTFFKGTSFEDDALNLLSRLENEPSQQKKVQILDEVKENKEEEQIEVIPVKSKPLKKIITEEKISLEPFVPVVTEEKKEEKEEKIQEMVDEPTEQFDEVPIRKSYTTEKVPETPISKLDYNTINFEALEKNYQPELTEKADFFNGKPAVVPLKMVEKIKALKETVKNIEDTEEDDDKIEVAIYSQQDNETICLIEGEKWQEKKEGLKRLLEFMEIRHDISINIFFRFYKLKLKNFKETNLNIVLEFLVALNFMIKKGDLFDKNNLKLVFKNYYDRITDKKLQKHIIDVILSSCEAYSPRFILSILVKLVKDSKAMQVIKEYVIVFSKVIEEFGVSSVPVKELAEAAVLFAHNTNQQIRKCASDLICAIYKRLGDDVKQLIGGIKEATLKNIEADMAKIQVEKDDQPKRKVKGELEQEVLFEPVDISKKLTPALQKNLIEGKWQDRKKAFDEVVKMLDEAKMKVLPAGMSNLFVAIKKNLQDNNSNVVSSVTELLCKLIKALGGNFKKYTKNIFHELISNLGDKKAKVREDTLKCLKEWELATGKDVLFAYFPKYLKNDNFEMRMSILEKLEELTENDKIDYASFANPLLECFLDRNSTVRNKAVSTIKLHFDKITAEQFHNATIEFKPTIKRDLVDLIRSIEGKTEPQEIQETEKKLVKSNATKSTVSIKSNISKSKTETKTSSKTLQTKLPSSAEKITKEANVKVPKETKQKRIELDVKFKISYDLINKAYESRIKEQVKSILDVEMVNKIFGTNATVAAEVLNQVKEHCSLNSDKTEQIGDILLKLCIYLSQTSNHPSILKQCAGFVFDIFVLEEVVV